MTASRPSMSVAVVRALVDRQFAQWAGRPVTEGPSAGAGNALFRLGDDLVVRLPLHPGSAAAVGLGLTWLHWLAAQLPLAIPVPVAAGEPDDVFPWPWAVHRWIRGTPLDPYGDVDRADAAVRLGRFVAALRDVDVAGADARALGAAGLVDEGAAVAVWDSALAAPSCDRPTWVHGDLFPMNLLAEGRVVSAVLDFDLMGAGDSAVDMVPAWTLLTPQTRPLFRDAAGVDDDTWLRGRGWALKAGLGAVRRYGMGDDPRAVVGRYALAQIIADHRRTS
jgi:aminoglycoside phosphotransferase (APT) family kinase protein